ncbi:MAG: hypothetical protein ABS81_04995 [Pseudonocardia sp. SCN 72-86]|nr:MAG: hypothetical protein ABS81_04995 [Pseudonocardia sp. SCN 72-86]
MQFLTRFWLVIPLAILVAYFSIQNPDAFLSTLNLRTLAETMAPILIAAVATTYILGSGGIDLSIGSVIVFSGVTAQLFYDANGGTDAGVWVVIVGFVLALVAGGVCGLINGVLIGPLRIPALIATLGTLGAFLGISQLLVNGNDLTNVPKLLTDHIGLGRLAGVPLAVWVAVVIAILGGLFLFKTRFGLRTLAIGSDVEVVKRRGINVNWHLLRLYTMAGVLYGIVGALSLARFSTTGISGQGTAALNAIAAVVIGGTSLFGGVATMFGTFLGVMIPAVLAGGLVIVGLQSFWQAVVVGIVLCVAVYFDQLQRRRKSQL